MTLLEALKQLRVMAASGCVPAPNNGICENSKIISGDCDCLLFVMSNSPSWQYYSSARPKSMPIPPSFNCGYWQGGQLDLRLSLINHMINRLENV